MKLTTKYKLATFILESSSNQNDTFGANGLPLTPSSIKMVGNFRSFIDTSNGSEKACPYLTTYVDCIRSKNEKISLVFEHYSSDTSSNATFYNDIDELVTSGLLALYHLHYVVGSIHGLITPGAFLYTGNKNHKFKLAHWPINLLTNSGQLCQSLIYPYDIRFLPIEQLLMSKPIRKSDIWSFGLTILYFKFPNIQDNFPDDPYELANCQSAEDVLKKLSICLTDLPDKWAKFFMATLEPHPVKRSSIKDLMKIFEIPEFEVNTNQFSKSLDNLLRTNDQNVDLFDEDLFEITSYLSLHDFYYLWCLTFPTKETDKEKQKLPPILSIPQLIILENELFSQEKYEHDALISELDSELNDLNLSYLDKIKIIRLPSNDNFKLLPIETINERLLKLGNEVFTPIVLSSEIFLSDTNKKSSFDLLPLPIREMDFDYQCERLMIFKSLLNGFPFLRNQLITEAKVDICPHYRAQIWASLLNVRWSDKLLYERIDKISTTSTDRQISVDIPRCHQYNDLLASFEGHRKLTRILKAWLAFNESNGEVYWQGLDSLAAPFVILNFNNEPQAFACFNLFIKKYLRGFFQKDNSTSIQEYLALFQIITSFHDPLLSNHLASLGFVPDLYAISWFLTMFTHILPLYQVVQLWDTLILGNDSFPLFIGLAILHQLRDRILDFSFNDCILIFSDLPQIDIDRCVRNSVKFFCSTPKSISKRCLWGLDSLKQFPRLPRIHLDDLLFLMEKNAQSKDSGDESTHLNQTCENQFCFVDCRTKEDISMYGTIAKSFSFEEFCAQLKQQQQQSSQQTNNKNSHHCCDKHNNNLIIVVNSIEKSMELIENYSVSRLCYLELTTVVPRKMMI